MMPEAIATIRLPARFRVVRELGRGGMGVVYEAEDQQLGIRVALKTFSRPDAPYLLRLKSEFRVLAGLSHPNLACLYELMEFEGQWFFTMELIPGTPLPEWVRAAGRQIPAAEVTETRTSTSFSDKDTWTSWSDKPPLEDAACFERLRRATIDLAEALEWLHAQGTLHRDIKGSNILVTPEERVVVLDFGLALHMSAGRGHEGHAGTPAYMAPERFRNAEPAPAEDWYSLGALLFEAIAGRHASTKIRKPDVVVPPVASLAPKVPQDLAALTDALLSIDPALRPTGSDILRRLRGRDRTQRVAPHAASKRVLAREAELSSLRDALALTMGGQTVAAVVHGASGMGKSSLSDRFLADVPADCLVLRGRCFEQESVPYKAFDGIVDHLAGELGRMRADQVSAVLPRYARTLAVLFPILLDVPEFAGAPQRAQEGLSPFEIRRRGTEAFRELLHRMGDRRPVILYIDDFQWADADSRQLLGDLLSPPSPPALMLLMTCREEERAHELLLSFLRGLPGGSEDVQVVETALCPLSPEAAEALARDIMPGRRPFTSEELRHIVEESGGHPYLLSELVAWLRSGQRDAGVGITLDGFLWRSISALPPISRSLLNLLSVCARPTRLRDLFAAASLSGTDPAWTTPLRAARLMSGSVTDPNGEVAVWHDRVRETVLSHLSARERQIAHRSLAEVLERSADADPETLAVHWHGCLRRDRAAHYYAIAAQRAASSLAFDHAAKLFGNAYGLYEGEPAGKRKLRVRLAEAFANAGRPLDSAHLYLEAAAEADGADSIDLRRSAAYQFCIGGHMQRGREEMLAVLCTQNIAPKSQQQATRSLIARQLWLMVRGYGFNRRRPEEIPPHELRLVDSTWSGATAVYMVDMVLGAELLTRNALQALRCGEPTRVARALAWNASMLAVTGTPMEKRVWRLVEITEGLAQESGDTHTRGMARLARGTSYFSLGYFDRCTQPLEEAHTIFTEECAGAKWEAAMASTVLLWAIALNGKYARAWPMAQRLYREARERNNLLEAANIAAATYYSSLLILDRPEEALEVLAQVRDEWKHEPSALQTILAMNGESITLRYMGRYEESELRMQNVREQAKRAGLLRSQWMRGGIANHMGLMAVSLLIRDRRREHKVVALTIARQLEKEKRAWGRAFAALIRAGVCSVEDRFQDALREVQIARAATEECGLGIWTQLLTYRAGQLTGGDEGRQLRETGEAAIRAELGVNLPGLLNFFTPMRTPETEG